MTPAEILAQLSDDTRVSVTVGQGDMRMRELRDALAGVDPHRVLTTGQAAELLGYSADSWRRWAPEIAGAYQDEGERALWRLPYTSCTEHLRRLQAERRTKRRRKRGPWSTSASAREAGSESLQAREVVRVRPPAMERRTSNDARPTTLRLAR